MRRVFTLIVDGLIIACADRREPIEKLARGLEREGFSFYIEEVCP